MVEIFLFSQAASSPMLTVRGQSDTDPVRWLKSTHISNFGKDKTQKLWMEVVSLSSCFPAVDLAQPWDVRPPLQRPLLSGVRRSGKSFRQGSDGVTRSLLCL